MNTLDIEKIAISNKKNKGIFHLCVDKIVRDDSIMKRTKFDQNDDR